ncbi:MAG TPA: hypothetical protein VJ000_05230 [Thermodesulfovibrionia bacterium]|nr:hypothetical protein [Thermodesulfovibrionia bacterium]
MERKKKEKKEDSCLPKVSSRKKPYLTLTHRLEKSGLEIKVSAKNEDWLKFREHYIFHPNKLLRDFLPIMEVAYLHSKPKTRHKKGQPKIDVLKVFSAILYKFLERIQQKKQYPECLMRVHKKFRQRKGFDVLDSAADFMDFAFMDYFKSMKFGHAHEDESCFYKVNIKPFYNNGEDDYNDYKNFLTTYIKGGLKIIQGTEIDKLEEMMREPHHWLEWERRFNHNTGNNDILEFLYRISMAIGIEFTYMQTGGIKTYKDKDGVRKPIIEKAKFKEISFIREVLKEIFPSLLIPDTYCRISFLPRP